ncbi:MAG: ATP-binding cassette domain-containing protein [Bacteroidia bacterium]|nr:ATP-binding cassette domain-containing protein [Bacteroidia bacterium]
MQLVLENISKSFENKVLFKNKHFVLKQGESYAVSGKNGSGKTTLLKIVMGYMQPDSGTVSWQYEHASNAPVQFQDFAFAGIQEQLFDDLTIQESIKFHFKFRNPICDNYLENIRAVFPPTLFTKKVNQLSAGWINRLKLVLAIFSKSKVLILDEPFSNMDVEGIEQMKAVISDNLNNRILIVAGNREEEFNLCKNRINL